MSRTWRRAPRTAHRRPRDNGARRAMMERLDGEIVPATRPRAIPPDAADDLRFSSETEKTMLRYLSNAYEDGHGFRRMVRRAQRRFSLSYHAAFAAMKAVASRNDIPKRKKS